MDDAQIIEPFLGSEQAKTLLEPSTPIALMAIEIMKVTGEFEKVKDYQHSEDSLAILIPIFLNYCKDGETLVNRYISID